ncbi:MscL family protein [Nocardioides alkalitolerans]|uniref:large conductance mechanosensitive channel protein MscL n=1 Tax=Nocardioides alkalitolerans TaxID=281714 RepID=UPI0003FB7965|nr:MscL family protein [Nocardioides alkalitolerans]
MTGFKNFLLRGNLIDLAVAVIIGTAFGAVVSTFTNWLTAQLPKGVEDVFTNKANTFGAFMNATISFVILAAVVYFLIVLPYTKAKEKYFPSPQPGTPEDVRLLQEIRDLLAAGQAKHL